MTSAHSPRMRQARPHIPAMVKLHAALFQLGFEPHEVELDHDPALALRPIDPETGDTIPPANDPRHLVWRPKAEHAIKTTGRRGESRKGDQAGGDTSRAAKVKRLSADAEQFRARLLAKAEGAEPAPAPRAKRKIPSRPFQRKTR